jgi:hypothetical protein
MTSLIYVHSPSGPAKESAINSPKGEILCPNWTADFDVNATCRKRLSMMHQAILNVNC